MSGHQPFDPSRQATPAPGPWVQPPAWGAPAPAPDPWGHEVGEDPRALLDASGHVRHQQEQLAHMIGAPVPLNVARERRQQLVLRVLIAVLVVAAFVAGGWFLYQNLK